MKALFISKLMGILFAALDSQTMKNMADMVLDAIEDKAKSTATQWDDAVVNGLTSAIREAFDIPDNDPPAAG